MSTHDADAIRQAVRKNYAGVVQRSGSCCCGSSDCCGASDTAQDMSARIGYAPEELSTLPDGVDMGLGCGNPQAIAAIQPGETVLDLGSGAGFDCFLAAQRVGATGQVIGVDMTPEMLSKARAAAREAGYANVEFRLGEIEALPVADASVDVILSNCVINLSPEKARVYREAFRVLKPGGRLAISDVVATAPLPDSLKDDPALLCGCVAGAASVQEITDMLSSAGFSHIRMRTQDDSRDFIKDWAPGLGIEDYVVSATVEAVKPAH